jgi:outer membrane protein OmpA-like peptidoglycan-associated protein
MANVFYDFNRGGTFQPYVGVGAGYAQLEVEDFVVDVDEGDFAWQAMAGVGIALSEQATLDLGYRYFSIPDVDAELPFGEGEGIPFTVEYEHQAATIGLRWQFAAAAPPPAPVVEPPAPPPPPPPPPVAAAACPTADFVVYFEWDRSNLNPAALETIDSAVRQAQACNLDAVVVVGHTDTSGSNEYNVGLSERRAAVVRDALAARGVPANVMRTEAHGETDLARATRDGVREPLNRRTAVTITFRP